MSFHLLKRISGIFADLVYPPRCPFCHTFVDIRDRPCLACDSSIIRLEYDAHLKLPGRIYLSRARSCFAYDGCMRDLLHSFKYGHRLDCARFFADSLLDRVKAMGHFDFIACVPGQGDRIVSRGVDACAFLAKQLSKQSGIALRRGVLNRSKRVVPQVGLPRDERMKNVTGVFCVAPRHNHHVDGARVLLVDDVLTTGATANDCARALIKAGAEEVEALTIARAL